MPTAAAGERSEHRYDRLGRVSDLGRQTPTPQPGECTNGRVRGAGGVLVRRERPKGQEPAPLGPRPARSGDSGRAGNRWGAQARAVLGPTATCPSGGDGATASSPYFRAFFLLNSPAGLSSISERLKAL